MRACKSMSCLFFFFLCFAAFLLKALLNLLVLYLKWVYYSVSTLSQLKQCYGQLIYRVIRYKNIFSDHLRLNPIQTRAGLLRPAPTLKMYNFITIKAITIKFGDFSYRSSGNILALTSRDHHLWRFHGNQFLTAIFFNFFLLGFNQYYFYGLSCYLFFSLSLATITQIRYNLAYILPNSVKYLF